MTSIQQELVVKLVGVVDCVSNMWMQGSEWKKMAWMTRKQYELILKRTYYVLFSDGLQLNKNLLSEVQCVDPAPLSLLLV